MRGIATWFVLAAVGLVVIAGVVDALRGSSSHAQSAPATESTVGDLATTAPSVQTTAEPVATTRAVAATQAVATTAPAIQSAQPTRLPSCATRQLTLALTGGNGLAALKLRRVAGEPCHHGRAPIAFTVRDKSGDRVAVFGGNTGATRPVDFSNGFEQLLEIPQMSCDPEGSFLVIATVGPYMVRRTLAGAELPCNHG